MKAILETFITYFSSCKVDTMGGLTRSVVFLAILGTVFSALTLTEAKSDSKPENPKNNDASAVILTTDVMPILESLLQEVQDIQETLLHQQAASVEKTSCSDKTALQILKATASKCDLLQTADLSKINSTYYFLCHLIPLRWYMADKHCKTYGMNLAVVDNQLIFDNIVRNLKDYVGQQDLGQTQVGFWIGGTDLGSERSWYWLLNSQRLSWTRWHPTQPDNLNGTENCLDISSYPKNNTQYVEGFPWAFSDRDCETNRQRFVCQLKLE